MTNSVTAIEQLTAKMNHSYNRSEEEFAAGKTEYAIRLRGRGEAFERQLNGLKTHLLHLSNLVNR